MQCATVSFGLSLLLLTVLGNFCFAQNVANLPASPPGMSKAIIQTSGAPSPIGPYSQAVVAGNMVFISGQVAKDPATGQLITDDIQSETKRVMDNIRSILAAAGIDFSHVVKTTIFLTDMKNFSAMNEVYGTYFSGEYPARETVQAVALPLGVNIEISMIAMR